MIAIIDYDAGNLTSVARALSHIGVQSVITNDKKEIERAERVIIPGVGAAGSAMISLTQLGLDGAIMDAFVTGKPILGICLGTQIIMGASEENDTNCLGIISGYVRMFPADIHSKNQSRLKIPHMGWNSVNISGKHPVLSDVRKDDEFYFVHGFYPDPDDSKHTLGTTEYGISFASIIGFKNILATQFHPEKSGKPGLTLLKNFCMWNPC